MWKPLEIEVYKQWVTDIIEEAQDNLTDWETTFIESIYNRLYNIQKNLTEPQAVKLEQIYTRYTS